jgi:hypothetical protein
LQEHEAEATHLLVDRKDLPLSLSLPGILGEDTVPKDLIPNNQLPPARLHLSKFPKSSKIAPPAGNQPFIHALFWGTVISKLAYSSLHRSSNCSSLEVILACKLFLPSFMKFHPIHACSQRLRRCLNKCLELSLHSFLLLILSFLNLPVFLCLLK